jgi:hypothetical protein
LTTGFCWEDNCPFPKSQTHEVGVFVERSLKVTVRGEQPETLSAVNSDTGACPALMIGQVKIPMHKMTNLAFNSSTLENRAV